MRYVGLVRELDGAVAAVDGYGFRTTPVVRAASIAEQSGSLVPGNVWVKDETGNEGGALDTVQTQGAWPLKRAFDRVATGIGRSVRLPATRPPNQATTSPPGQERSTS